MNHTTKTAIKRTAKQMAIGAAALAGALAMGIAFGALFFVSPGLGLAGLALVAVVAMGWLLFDGNLHEAKAKEFLDRVTEEEGE